MVTVFWPKGATREVTKEYSAPVEKYFNHESYCSALHLISAVGSWGQERKSPVPFSPILPRPDQEGSHLEVAPDIGWVLRSPSNSDILTVSLAFAVCTLVPC